MLGFREAIGVVGAAAGGCRMTTGLARLPSGGMLLVAVLCIVPRGSGAGLLLEAAKSRLLTG